jgi:glucosamine-6-phosphate deaminase
MEIKVYPTSSELAENIAKDLAQKLALPLNIGFATGRTMEPIYKALRESFRGSPKAHGWILDEYLGLKTQDPQSYRFFLNQKVFLPLGFSKPQVHFPNLEILKAHEAAEDYEQQIGKLGGLDLQLLGLGLNGHVGLNEPGSTSNSITRVVQIAQSTRLSNQEFFASLESVPKEAITLGLSTLAQSKSLWLIATGDSKAKIVKEILQDEISTERPASLLRKHSGLVVHLDEAAAKFLK